MAKAFINFNQHTLLLPKLPALFTFGALSVLLLPQIALIDNRCLQVNAVPVELSGDPKATLESNPIPLFEQPDSFYSASPSVPNVTQNSSTSSSSEELANSTTTSSPSPPPPPPPTKIIEIVPPESNPNLLVYPLSLPIDEHIDSFIDISNHESNNQVYFALEIVIRVSVFIYCCLVIGYLCDEFFVTSLESIGEALNLPNDLIGAILIPFGTSGPEIFSSAVGVFFAENDIGTGAIIGSAVFNILAIPAASGLAASYFLGKSIKLDEAPILRDLSFYIVSIIVLILVIKDNRVDLIDSSLLAILFIIYISVMLYNAKFAKTDKGHSKEKEQPLLDYNQNNQHYHSYQGHMGPVITVHNNCSETLNNARTTPVTPATDKNSKNKIKEYLNKCNEIMVCHNQPLCQNQKLGDADQYDNLLLKEYYNYLMKIYKETNNFGVESKLHSNFEGLIHKQYEIDMVKSKMDYEKLDEEDSNGFGFTENLFLRIILMPFIVIFNLTMPNRFPWVTFVFSICWLSVLSYGTVWAISGLSDMIGIPQTISGMTILAAGSAVPDLVTSIIVIKKTGTASMGICAGIASNIFAILLGLGLPWGIQCLLIWIKSGTYATSMVMLHSSALPYTSIILLATIVALYFTFRISKWEISKRFSLICVLIHVVFVISSTYLEIYVS